MVNKTKKAPKRGAKQPRARRQAAEVIRVGTAGWKAAEQLRKHVARHGWGHLASSPEIMHERPTLGLVVNEAVKAVLAAFAANEADADDLAVEGEDALITGEDDADRVATEDPPL